MKKRILSVLLVLMFLMPTVVPLLGQRSFAAGNVYFTSVNDVLCNLNDETMPFWSAGNLYVPSSVFSSYDLNLSYLRDTAAQMEYLYNREKIIEFDLANGGANNKLGTYYSANAISKNGSIYFPLAFVCSYFGLNYTIVETRWVPMVRVTNGNAILTDAQFTDAATSLMDSRYTAYQQSKKPAVPVKPTVPVKPDPPVVVPEVPTVPTVPTVPVVPDNTDETTDETTKTTAKVYLALRARDPETLSGMLNTLDRYRYKATIFFDPEHLSGYDDLLRRIISTGHGIGFVWDGKRTAVLDEGNEQLRKMTGTTTRMVLPAETDVNAEGYAAYTPVFQSEKMGTSAASQSGRLFSRIEDATGNAKVLIGGDETAASVLTVFCRNLYSNRYTVRAANEVLCD